MKEEDRRSLQLRQQHKILNPERKRKVGGCGRDMKHERTFIARWRRGIKQERTFIARWRRSPHGGKEKYGPRTGSAGPGPDASTHNAARQPPTPRGFADWSASTSAFTSLAVQSTPSTATANAYHYSLSPCYAFWTHYMLNKNAYSYYPAPNQEHTHPFSLDNNQAKDPGSIPNFGIESFNTTSLAPSMSAHMPPMEGPLSTKEPEASEDMPARVVAIKDERDARNGIELKCETVDALPELKQGHESCATKFNSGEYQVILRKELTKSDVANVGRIVLPKKDAEASLPPLCERDPVILQMDDMVLPVTWKFKYRFWPNNKSRMYILDSTSEFVKTHGLQAGDALIIYKNPVPGKYIVRGEKAIQQTN